MRVTTIAYKYLRIQSNSVKNLSIHLPVSIFNVENKQQIELIYFNCFPCTRMMYQKMDITTHFRSL